ncbi:hypothetical protein BDA99DRAFT_555904 [Phascolomyces articulosus]|uniref:6-pyruvoyl tetrahydrobiopterin synthase n=1 Tax=Phascolomyces articulosus TaxID=60185 RepID=A0AAD5K8H7_9FUNG|nr:hypothetical protein BDA99DRAFT_555904 [Phascolomyces articulosus]
MPPITYLTRTASFSAAHRLHSPHLSNEENTQLYGKCNNPNYHVEITVKGEINQETGMVMNMVDLKACINSAIMDILDHKNLDCDVEFFRKRPSTTENLAVFIWCNFDYHFQRHPASKTNSAQLYKVKVHETDSNSVEFMGECGEGLEHIYMELGRHQDAMANGKYA